jgi:tetratricopeptide (TPR) repeat protein
MAVRIEGVNFDTEASLLAQARRLKAESRFQEADALLSHARTAFPASETVAEQWVLAAHALNRIDEAVDRLVQATGDFPASLILHKHLLEFLQFLGRLPEAERILERLKPLAEGTPVWQIARLRFLVAQHQHEQALAVAGELRAHFPKEGVGYTLAAQVLRQLGRFDRAEAILLAAATEIGSGPGLLLDLAKTAAAASNWQLAFDRLLEVRRSLPDWDTAKTALGETLGLWRHAAIEGDPNAKAVIFPKDFSRIALTGFDGTADDADGNDAAEIMLRFESMGDGCEFGLVQRKFGAEPLGLLRWSHVSPSQLCGMLETRFAGIGEPEHALINVLGDEYFVGDSRYFMMHSFMKTGQISEEAMLEKSISRMRYLKDEMLCDLDEGNKIFVYKPTAERLSADQMEQIFSLFRAHYPNASVLVAHKASEPAEIGTVRQHGDRLFEAFLDQTNVIEWLISYEKWFDICRRVSALATLPGLAQPD